MPKKTAAPARLRVETRELTTLTIDPANVRKHSDRNLEAIKASLVRFGQQKPLVVDEKGIVRAGNGTLQAARDLGWETIDVVVSSLNAIDLAAYAIADNRTAELAEWDLQMLAAAFQAIEEAEIPLSDLGWEKYEVDPLLSADWTPRDVNAPEANASFPIRLSVAERERFDEIRRQMSSGDELPSDAEALMRLCDTWDAFEAKP